MKYTQIFFEVVKIEEEEKQKQLEPTCRGLQSMFRSKNKKNRYTPLNPIFTLI